jgi:hypothetical protein
MLLTVRNEKPVSGGIPEAFYKTISWMRPVFHHTINRYFLSRDKLDFQSESA